MMNCHSRENPQKIIQELLELLHEERISALIEQPIDKAVERLLPSGVKVHSYHEFLDSVAECVRIVYANGLPAKLELTLAQAKGEAIHLLEQGYSSLTGQGFNAAVLDTLRSEQGDMNQILTCLIEIIKERRKQEYTQWMIAKYLLPLDWYIKVEIVRYLFERIQQEIPAHLQQAPPEQFVDLIPQLIFLQMKATNQIEQHFKKFCAETEN